MLHTFARRTRPLWRILARLFVTIGIVVILALVAVYTALLLWMMLAR